MPLFAKIILIAVLGVLAMAAIWLFLIAPRARKAAMRPFMRPYAHRGLWGDEIPENSLAAFRRAAENGFAIELDVQLSADNVVMVFHDYTLTRMCGVDFKVSELSAAQLGSLTLGESNERIPTFRQVLQAVGGRVPLLIELKGEGTDTSLVPRVLAELARYEGKWCIESFNPILLGALKRMDNSVVRGLLSTDLIREKRKGSPVLNAALSGLLLTFLCRPAFHAWDKKYPKRFALNVGLGLFGAASVVYTVRDEEEYNRYLDAGLAPIFEGFVPTRHEVKHL